MPNCAQCQTPLLLPADEYGPFDAPLCRECFLSQDLINDPEMEIKAVAEKIKEYLRAANDAGRHLSHLRGALQEEYSEDALDDIKAEEDERDILMDKLGELRTRHYNLLRAVKDERLKEQAKLCRWTEGAYGR